MNCSNIALDEYGNQHSTASSVSFPYASFLIITCGCSSAFRWVHTSFKTVPPFVYINTFFFITEDTSANILFACIGSNTLNLNSSSLSSFLTTSKQFISDISHDVSVLIMFFIFSDNALTEPTDLSHLFSDIISFVSRSWLYRLNNSFLFFCCFSPLSFSEFGISNLVSTPLSSFSGISINTNFFCCVPSDCLLSVKWSSVNVWSPNLSRSTL